MLIQTARCSFLKQVFSLFYCAVFGFFPSFAFHKFFRIDSNEKAAIHHRAFLLLFALAFS